MASVAAGAALAFPIPQPKNYDIGRDFLSGSMGTTRRRYVRNWATSTDRSLLTGGYKLQGEGCQPAKIRQVSDLPHAILQQDPGNPITSGL